MPEFKISGIEIAGIASAVPEEEVTVDSFAGEFGESYVSRVQKLTGVSRFRRAGQNQTAADLGVVAAKNLFQTLGVDPEEVTALVFLSHSGDYRRPATACVIHQRLGLSRDVAAFDVNLGCSGFPYGLYQVASMMSTSDIDVALLICAETMTKLASNEDRTTATLFGDCGTATLLRKTGTDRQIKGLLQTDGTGFDSIIVPAGGFRDRFAPNEKLTWPDGNRRSLHDLHMDGKAVLDFSLTQVPTLINLFLERNQTSATDYGAVVLHQANLHIMKQIARKIGAPPESVPVSLDRYGNTSSASIPLTLSSSAEQMSLSPESEMLMCGFGVGLSLGVISAQISRDTILPVVETSETFQWSPQLHS